MNVTDNYAPVDTLRVMVTDASGKPVKGARVDYRLYNCREFFPVATLETDAEGRSELVAYRVTSLYGVLIATGVSGL